MNKNFDNCTDIAEFLALVTELAKTNKAYGVAVTIFCKDSVGTVQYNITKADLALGASALYLFSEAKESAKLH